MPVGQTEGSAIEPDGPVGIPAMSRVGSGPQMPPLNGALMNVRPSTKLATELGRASETVLGEVGAGMATLNRDAAEQMVRCGAHACTDVTGYGLGGHLVEMARGSGLVATVDLSALPVYAAAAECLDLDILSGAIERNQDYVMAWVRVPDPPPACLPILYDPQTSGGLLVSLPAAQADDFVTTMRDLGHAATSRIGAMTTDADGWTGIVTHGQALENLVGVRGGIKATP